MRFMGVDMGTSGCKAVVFDENWNAVCQAYREYPMSFPGEGLLELDAERVWREICQVIREANSKAAGEIAALAVSAIGDVLSLILIPEAVMRLEIFRKNLENIRFTRPTACRPFTWAAWQKYFGSVTMSPKYIKKLRGGRPTKILS